MKKLIKRSKTAKPQILLSVRHVVHYEQIWNSYGCTCELFAWNCKTRFKDLHTANFINFPRVKPGTDPEWSVSCVRSVCMQLMSLSLWKHWSGCIRQHGVGVCVSLKQAGWEYFLCLHVNVIYTYIYTVSGIFFYRHFKHTFLYNRFFFFNSSSSSFIFASHCVCSEICQWRKGN